MKIDVSIDTSRLKARTVREAKNLAYSTVQAINDVAKDVQTMVRADIKKKFKLRKGDWLLRQVKIKTFANVRQGRLYAELEITPRDRLLLSIFEVGGKREPFKGKNVAVPITGEAARESISQSVDPAYTFKALKFRRMNLTKAGQQAKATQKRVGVRGRLTNDYYIWGGQNRTFILPKTAQAQHGGVFQRIGPKRDDIRLIYSFKPAMTLPKVLDFVETARERYAARFRELFEARYKPSKG